MRWFKARAPEAESIEIDRIFSKLQDEGHDIDTISMVSLETWRLYGVKDGLALRLTSKVSSFLQRKKQRF